MSIRKALLAMAGAAALAPLAVQPARADQVLYDGVGFMQGTQSFTDTINLASSGSLTVTLGNVGWPQPLSSLSLLLSNPSGSLGSAMNASLGTDTETFNVGPGDLTAQWFGTAQGALDAGVYSLEIQFAPNVSPGSAVPLPTSVALLLSGLGLLVWQRKARPGGLEAESLPMSTSPGGPAP